MPEGSGDYISGKMWVQRVCKSSRKQESSVHPESWVSGQFLGGILREVVILGLFQLQIMP